MENPDFAVEPIDSVPEFSNRTARRLVSAVTRSNPASLKELKSARLSL